VPSERIPSLAHYLVPVHSSDLENPFSDGGSLSLLPAGRRSPSDTPSSLSSFEDKRCFGWLREQLLREADVVLIDAPRAIPRGIGTQTLADVAVCFCEPDEETQEGTSRMLEALRSEDSLAARDHRPLEIVLVPVRLDPVTSEQESDVDQRLARLNEQSPLPAPLQARGVGLAVLQIAYPSESAFREHAADPSEGTYAGLASSLALLAPEAHPLRRPAAEIAPPADPLGAPPSGAVARPLTLDEAFPETTATESMPSLPTMLELFDEIRRELDAMPEPLVPDEPLTAPPATADAAAAAPEEVPVTAPAITEPAPPLAETAPPTPPFVEPTPPVASLDASERTTRPDPDRDGSESVEEPKQSLTSRPVVFETTPPPAETSKRSPRTPAWAWPAAGASLLVLVAAVYLGTQGHGDSNASSARETAAAPIAEKQTPAPPVVPAMPAAPSPPVQDQAPQPAKAATAPKGVAPADPHPDQGAPGSMYLRVGWGPSCPRILNYRKQFLAAGIPDAGAVQLKAGGCALVLGPYSPDVVERKRKEQNARHIRGFDNVTVIDDRDFAKWL